MLLERRLFFLRGLLIPLGFENLVELVAFAGGHGQGRAGADHLGHRLGCRRRVGSVGVRTVGRAERFGLESFHLGFVGAVLALELKMLPDCVVKDSHGGSEGAAQRKDYAVFGRIWRDLPPFAHEGSVSFAAAGL